MCGIAGYVGTIQVPQENLDRCRRLMVRRGPDQQDTRHFVNKAGLNIHLLHSRLSIIDLDPRSNQPMSVGPLTIVLNGELYNYKEIRQDLLARGCHFRTTSDTEVLLAAVEKDGWDVLDRLEGMWAFAVYDANDGSLVLCRDRFGEKPLYLYRDQTGLYFGSEVKFIAALCGRSLAINRDQIYRYLINGYKSLYKEGHSFFSGLEELAPASLLTVNATGVASTRRYWLPPLVQDDTMSYEVAVEGARERLARSMELRLRADVPLAFCMSGGVDSNALISTARRVHGHDVHGFTVMTADERYDEEELVAAAVQELGIRHTAVRVSSDGFLPRLRELIRYHDAPVYTITYYVQWLLMEQIAAQGYRISISGTAADELFTGYYDHHLAYLYEIRGLPELHETSRRNWLQHIEPIVLNPFLKNANVFVENPEFRNHIYLEADRFAGYMMKPWFEPFRETGYVKDLLRNRMLNELFHEAVPVILHEDDLNSMYYSVENRSPYLDRDLFEFCFSIPTRHLIRDGYAKAILRDSMRGILPDAIRSNRRKVGFNAPVEALLRKDPTGRREILEDSPIWEFVRRDAIEGFLGRDRMVNSESKFLFNFLNAKVFLEEFGQ
jgi:asparagine synthase (glutamine-hydrolysing)